MSDYVPDIPYAPGTPEYEQYLRTQGIFPMAVGSGALTQVLTLREGEGGRVEPALPGIVTGGYGMVGASLPDLITRAFGGQGPGYHLPGAEAARQSWEDTANIAQRILPSRAAAEATGDPTIQAAENVGEGIGAATVPLPGATARGITAVTGALPKGVGIPLRVATNLATAPEAKHLGSAIPISAGLGAGAEALMANDADAAQVNQPQLDASGNLVIPDPRMQASQGGTNTLPFDTTSPKTNLPTPPTQDSQGLATGTSDQAAPLAQAPTYGREGEGWTSYLDGLVKYGIPALVGGWVMLKYGGHIYNRIPGIASSVDRNVAIANAEVRARDTGTAPVRTSLAQGPDIEVPLPAPEPRTTGVVGWLDRTIGQTPADAPSRQFINEKVNKNTIVNATIDATTPNQTTADALKNTVGTTNSSQAFNDAFKDQARTGVNMITKAQGPKLYDLAQTVDQMTPAQREAWSAGQFSGSELQYRNSGELPFELSQQSDAELGTARAAMMTDPITAQARNQVQMLNGARWDAEVASGMRTQASANQMKMMHPDWMPSLDADGSVVERPVGAREPGGPVSPPTDALTAVIRADESAYKAMQHNKMNRDVIDNLHSWSQADPNRPIIVSKYMVSVDKVDPVTGQTIRTMVPGSGGEGRIIKVFRNGQPEEWLVNNSILYNAMKSNPKQMGHAIDVANKIRGFMQANITGPMAALTQQRLFGLTQLGRTLTALPMSAEKGTYAGPADLLSQKVLGLHYRLPDPSMVGYTGYTAANNMAAVFAKNMGDMFGVRSNPVSQAMRGIIGDRWTDAFAHRMSNYYAGSSLAGDVSEGAARLGSGGFIEAPTFLGSKPLQYMNPLAEQFPNLFYNTPGKSLLPGTKATYINWRTLVRDLHAQVSDAGNAAYYRLNRANPDFTNETMARLSRGLIGDTSMTGAGATAQAASKLIPYFNPIVQDSARMIKNFRDAPFNTVLGATSVLTTMALASTLSAMMGGPDAVNHLENQITTQQRGSDVTIYHDPSNYLNHSVISLPQRLRWLYPLILEGVSTGVGAFQAHAGEPMGDRIINSIADFFNHHIQTSTETAARRGAYSMFDISPSADVTAAAALGGKNIGEFPGQLIENAIHGQPLFSNLFRDAAEADKVPGQLGSTSYLSHNDGKNISDFLTALGGGIGAAYHTFLETPWERIHEGATPWAATIAAGSDVLQNFRDQNPMGNFIWGNNVKLNKFDPMAEGVSNALANMKMVGNEKDVSSIGSVEGYPTSIRDANKVPADPTMRDMWLQVADFRNQLQPLEQERNAISTNMQQVVYGGDSAQDKRTLLNGFTGQYADVTAQLDAQINWLNARLSQMAGGRVVDVRGKINWYGDVSQFHQ